MLRPVPLDGWTEVVSALDVDEVNQLSTEQRNEVLGVALLTQVQVWFPDSANKIVGMLLEASTEEILDLLNDADMLYCESKKALGIARQGGNALSNRQWQPASDLKGVAPSVCTASDEKRGRPKRATKGTVQEQQHGLECSNSFEVLCGDTVPAADKGFPAQARQGSFGESRSVFMENHNSAQCRQVCEDRAVEVLEWYACHGGDPTADVVEYVMEMWDGRKNHFRKRVNPQGQDYVRSMALGLIARHTGECSVSVATSESPNVTKVLNAFMASRVQNGFLGLPSL